MVNKIKKVIAILKKEVMDTVLPKFCVGCGKEGTWLCGKCRSDIVLVQMQVCPECGRLSSGGRYCLKHRKEKSLKGIIASAYYEEGPTRELIHNFKYNGVTELDEVLAGLLFDAFRKLKISIDCITFAPLHSKRLAQRGYNQAEILAMKLSKLTGVDTRALLIKKKATKRQVELTGVRRRRNLKGVFELRMKNSELIIKGKRILIIDDVTTTGATLNECALVLKNAGAKEVWGLVIARG